MRSSSDVGAASRRRTSTPTTSTIAPIRHCLPEFIGELLVRPCSDPCAPIRPALRREPTILIADDRALAGVASGTSGAHVERCQRHPALVTLTRAAPQPTAGEILDDMKQLADACRKFGGVVFGPYDCVA